MKTVVILGMHRSATSLIARCLHESGEVHMGAELLSGLTDNPKGHYENEVFLRLNIDILKEAGGAWDKPPSRDRILALRDKSGPRIKRVVKKSTREAESAGFTSWGFKDPRTVLTIELYMPYLTDPQFVCCYRDQTDVAKSLNRRDGIPIPQGMELAKDYGDRLNSFMNNWMNVKASIVRK